MTRAHGADFSVWQDDKTTPQKVDFTKARAAGLDFAFIKASQAAWADPDMIYNWQAAKDAGLLRGAYHFLVWNVDPVRQADFFCGLLHQCPPEIGYVCDFEWWQTIPSNALDICRRFVERVEANTGKPPFIYTAPGFWNQYGSKDEKWARYPLWVAHWGATNPIVPAPWKAWTFWQYTAKGSGKQYGAESADLDLNWYNGTVAELHAAYGKPAPPPVVDPLVDLEQLVIGLSQDVALAWADAKLARAEAVKADARAVVAQEQAEAARLTIAALAAEVQTLRHRLGLYDAWRTRPLE
jgi:lysozyme